MGKSYAGMVYIAEQGTSNCRNEYECVTIYSDNEFYIQF